jgi:hypothetical protein
MAAVVACFVSCVLLGGIDVKRFLCIIGIMVLSLGPVVTAAEPVEAPVEWTSNRTGFHPEKMTKFFGIPLTKTVPDFIRSGQTTFNGVQVATGASVTKEALLKEDRSRYTVVVITDEPYNAKPGVDNANAVHNTAAINRALQDVSMGGGVLSSSRAASSCSTR